VGDFKDSNAETSDSYSIKLYTDSDSIEVPIRESPLGEDFKKVYMDICKTPEDCIFLQYHK
jgi:hypothetical protein